MKVLSVPALLAAALFSAVVALPFLPLARTEAGPFFFEANLTSSVSGAAQLYHDGGSGFSEAASSRVDVVPSTTPHLYRLGIPAGTYRALRFDPLDRTTRMTIERARIVSPSGRVVHEFAPTDFRSGHQIASLQPNGHRLEVTTAVNGDDPQLIVSVPAPIVAQLTMLDWAARIPRVSLISFALFVVGLLAFERQPRWRTRAAGAVQALTDHPKRAVAVVAAIAVIVSAYPIVFLGKSYVSPNLGTILLYDAYPTLPGYDNHEVADVQLSDVGAIMWQHVPFSMVQHRALSHGELPLWNPDNSVGTPLLAQGQSMFGDPLHFLVILSNGAAWAWDLKYLIAKWLFAVALGLIVLETLPAPASSPDLATKRSRFAAFIIAGTAPFIGFFLYRLNHPAFFSLCYAPWPLYCWLRVASAKSIRGTAAWGAGLVVANIALMCSGTAKEAYMLLLTMNFSGLCALLASATPWRIRLVRLGAMVWAGVIFALVTAPVWVTFLHTLRNAYTSYNEASAFQLQPAMLLGLFDEVFFRPLMPQFRMLDPSLNFLLLLGLLYFVATLRSSFSNRVALALAASSLVPLALAFGLVPPQWIVRWPILANVAHLDNTFGCALLVLWTALAGVGIRHAADRLGTPEGRADVVIVGLLLFALVFQWIAFGQVVHRPVLGPTTFTVHKAGEALPVSPFIWWYLLSLLLASLVLLVVVRRALVRGALSAPGGILLALSVVVLVWRFAVHAPSVGFRGYVQEPTERVDFHAKSAAVAFMQSEVRAQPARGFGLHGNFFPGWTAAYGLATVHGPDAIMSPYFRALETASGIQRLWDWRLYVDPSEVGAARPFLDALNVRWYFDLKSDQGLLGQSLKLAKVADLDVYESPTAWPRAFFTDRVLRYGEPAEFVDQIRKADGMPFAAVQFGDSQALGAVEALSDRLEGRTVQPATHYVLTENTTAFDVQAPRAGVVVLTTSWWPGDFRATLNGKRTPVLRLNHAFLGIQIPAEGDYRVTFAYWPHNFLRSLLASAAGALLLVLSIVLAFRSSSPEPAQ